MHTRHLTTPTQALYRVFVLPALRRTPTSSRISRQQRTLRGPRHFTTSVPVCAKTRAPEIRKELWNEEIPSSQIFLLRPNETNILDPETGRPPDPINRDRVLRSLDQKAERLVQVAEGISVSRASYGDEGGEEAQWIDIPLCKIVNKKEQYDHQRQRKEASKEQKKKSAAAASVKTLELNWAIDPNDLGHRLDKVRQFLGEGRKVEVVLASKKKGRKATAAECNGLLENIRKAANEAAAREVGPMEGKLGGFTVLRFQGKTPS